MSLQRIFVSYPSITYGVLTAALALPGLTVAPSFLPVIALLTTIILHTQSALPRSVLHLIPNFLIVTIANALSNFGPTSTAVPGSLAPIILASLLSSLVVLSIVIGCIIFTRKSNVPLEFVFPALWATAWTGIARYSPLGRLGTWSPLRGEVLEAYSYLRQWGGAPAIDWVAAMWAVTAATALGAWIVGSSDHEASNGHDERQREDSHSHSRFVNIALLAFLTAPTLFFNNTPQPVNSPNSTPFGVACILPKPSPAISDFIRHLQETKAFASRAKILLWPEGAVRFENPTDRDEAFKEVGKTTSTEKVWVGVSFEEPMGVPAGERRRNRNGMALIGPSGEVALEYYKRHLVPIAESFGQAPSEEPLKTIRLNLPRPPSIPRKDWGSPPDYTRPISITASICLDFAFPLTGLETRPGLLLAPARTWDTAVGLAMWRLARTRAEELGTSVLWCDGGEGGVSGLGSSSNSDVQVGSGSWLKTVSLPYPYEEFESTRTVYSWGGEWIALGGIWSVFFLSMAIQNAERVNDLPYILYAFQSIKNRWVAWRRVDNPDLIAFDS